MTIPPSVKAAGRAVVVAKSTTAASSSSTTGTAAAVAVAVAAQANSKPPSPKPIVSPTPTPEQLGDLATEMVQKSGSGSKTKAKPTAKTKVKPTAKTTTTSAASASASMSMPPTKKQRIGNSSSSSSSSTSKTLNFAATATPPSHRPQPPPYPFQKEAFPTVGYHDELAIKTRYLPTPSKSSYLYPYATATIAKGKATTTAGKAGRKAKALSAAWNSNSKRPPLLSRYCGGCGDILSTKAYGFDAQNRDRRLLHHPHDTTYHSTGPRHRPQLVQAATTVRTVLATMPPVKAPKASSSGGGGGKSTKASRKKKKLAAAAAAAAASNASHSYAQPVDPELVRDLEPWPDESFRMDMTLLEGLLALKTAPLHETSCRCWKPPGAATTAAAAKTSSPKTKKAKAAAAAAAAKAKTKPAVAKKKTSAKAGSSLTHSTSNSTGSIATEVVSTKYVYSKCPKTGKTLKKKVRVVKKLVKKKTPKKSAASAAAGSLKTPPSPTLAAAISKYTKAMALGKASGIPSFTALGTSVAGGTKDKLTQQQQQQNQQQQQQQALSPSHTPLSQQQRHAQHLAQSGKKRSLEHASSSSSHSPHPSHAPQPQHPDHEEGSGSEDSSEEDGTSKHKPPHHHHQQQRRRNDEKADVELRERLMNCPLENGPLFPSQQELMELTTIRKRNALQTFYKRFNELRQFIAIFGDANVPQQFPENHSLGIWVNKMRMERKKWDTGSERTSLTERKIELLESIDFIWAQNHKGEIGWERRFQEIRKFKRKHGHCNVPTKSAENRALGRWVSTQRTMYKNYMKGFVGKSLTREEQERRIFLLLKEGFLFSMIPNGHGGGGGEGDNAPTKSAPLGVTPQGQGATTNDTPTATTAQDAAPNTVAAAAKPTPSVVASSLTTGTKESDTVNIASSSSSSSNGGDEAKTNEPLQDSTQPIDDSKESVLAEGQNLQDKDAKEVNVAPLSSSPSLGTNKEVLSSKPQAATEASSPAPSRAPSIAQVSITTTPTTTPSVSTTASPDRSPEKPISSGDDDEQDCVKASKVKEMAKSLVQESRKANLIATTGAMPVVPSLKKESVAKAAGLENSISVKQATTGIQSHFASTEKPSMETTTPAALVSETSPRDEKTSKLLKEKGTSPRIPTPKSSKKKTTPVSSPAASPRKDNVTNARQGKAVKNKSSTPTPSRSRKAANKRSSPPTPPSAVAAAAAAAEPQLITSDGLRIIVTMKDSEEAAAATQRSPTTRKGIAEGSPSMVPSPSRRSVRARKPSARQLEAEKSPLRESILGR